MTRLLRPPLVGVVTASLLAALALAPAVSAHYATEVGEYAIEVGWLNEPTFVGEPNAVQITILLHADESPVTDLGPDDLKVVVSTSDQQSASLSFDPAFDAEEGEGPLGQYVAAIVPTAPGDYTFHITGSIHGTAVDITAVSGDETFNTVEVSTDLEFPAKLPTLTEVGTRLDRIDSRIAAIQSADPNSPALAAAKAATDAAKAASDAANQALLVGVLLGGAGVLLAAIALAMTMRGRRGGGLA